MAYVKLTTMQERITREGLASARDLTNTSHRNRQTMGQKLTRGYWEVLERYELGSRQGKATKGTVMCIHGEAWELDGLKRGITITVRG